MSRSTLRYPGTDSLLVNPFSFIKKDDDYNMLGINPRLSLNSDATSGNILSNLSNGQSSQAGVGSKTGNLLGKITSMFTASNPYLQLGSLAANAIGGAINAEDERKREERVFNEGKRQFDEKMNLDRLTNSQNELARRRQMNMQGMNFLQQSRDDAVEQFRNGLYKMAGLK